MRIQPNEPFAPGIDHAMIIVSDLEDARRRYERLGFSITARAQHPHTGTENYLAILDSTYVELLGIAQPGQANEPFRKALAQREGYWLTAVRTEDAAAEHARLISAGFTLAAPATWSRPRNIQDPREVSFSTLLLPPYMTPEAGFFYCQHHDRGAVFEAGTKGHPNGAQDISGAIVVSDKIPELASAYPRVFGDGCMVAEAARASLQLGTHAIRFESESQFRSRTKEMQLPKPLRGPTFAALQILVRDLALTRGHLKAAGVQFVDDRDAGWVWIHPEESCAVVLGFSSSSE